MVSLWKASRVEIAVFGSEDRNFWETVASPNYYFMDDFQSAWRSLSSTKANAKRTVTIKDFSWTLASPLPISYADAGGSTVTLDISGEQHIFLGGGYPPTNAAYLLDNMSQSYRIANMPGSYKTCICKGFNNHIYVFGGDDISGSLTSLYREYDPVSDTWNTGSDSQIYDTYMNCATDLDGNIHLLGGNAGHYRHLIYFPINQTFAASVALPTSQTRGSAFTATNGDLYYIGTSTYVLPYGSTSWITRTAKPAPNVFFSYVYHPELNMFFAIGGYLNSKYIHVYDVANDIWTSLADFPIGIHDAVSVIANNKIHVLGGSFSGSTAHYYSYFVCDDSDPCTEQDIYSNGICKGTSVYCNSTNECYQGYCYDSTSMCIFSNTTTCDDNDPCTVQDTCYNSTCVGTSYYCNSTNECYQGYCYDSDSMCIFSNITTCDDNDPCTTQDTCHGSTCAGTSIYCSNCFRGYCYDSTSMCIFSNTTTCNDNDPCTVQDTCYISTCVGTSIYCNTTGSCFKGYCYDSTSMCIFSNTTTCNDNDPCTVQDTCYDSTCVGTHVYCNSTNDCSQLNCYDNSICISTNGLACNDSDSCTVNDTCISGGCVGNNTCVNSTTTGGSSTGSTVTSGSANITTGVVMSTTSNSDAAVIAQESKKLSPGQITGIVIGAFMFFLLLLIIFVLIRRNRKEMKPKFIIELIPSNNN